MNLLNQYRKKRFIKIIKKIYLFTYFMLYVHIAMHISALDGQGDLHGVSTNC